MNKQTLSVVISAHNEEKNIAECIKSVKTFADEIIVVDNSSTDKTSEAAQKAGAKIFKQKNDPTKIDLLKNFGFAQTTSDWILSLDADERVTPELAMEITRALKDPLENVGFYIPRKNITFGKWIEHTGWYPDYQLRLFKKGVGKFEKSKVHEPIVVAGKLGKLKQDIYHQNYQTVNQFIQRLVVYTDSEAKALATSGKNLTYLDAIKMPFDEFLRRFFTQEGYKDGLHGLVLSLFMAFYHLVIFAKVWEGKKFGEQQTDIESLKNESKKMGHELAFWILDAKKNQTHNPIRRKLMSIAQKRHKSS